MGAALGYALQKGLAMTIEVQAHAGDQSQATRPVTVTVNRKPVVFGARRATGAEIKETAIAQGVQLQPDFALFAVVGGGQLKPVSDNDAVEIHEGEAFRAVAPDDNS